jgi:hypothetical protein
VSFLLTTISYFHRFWLSKAFSGRFTPFGGKYEDFFVIPFFLIFGNSALACQFFPNPDEGIVYVESGALYLCETSRNSENVTSYTCVDRNGDHEKTLEFNLENNEAIFDENLNCKEGTFPNFCIWSGSC